MYLSHTKPDLAYSLNVVSQFMHSPNKEHIKVVINILKYLKSSLGKRIMLIKGDAISVEGYIEVDWAGSIDDRYSIAGFLMFAGGNLVTWRNKK